MLWRLGYCNLADCSLGSHFRILPKQSLSVVHELIPERYRDGLIMELTTSPNRGSTRISDVFWRVDCDCNISVEIRNPPGLVNPLLTLYTIAIAPCKSISVHVRMPESQN
jgi:hypothetical protein